MKKVIASIIFIFLFFSCDPKRPVVYIVNNSPESIFCFYYSENYDVCLNSVEDTIKVHGNHLQNPRLGKSGDTIIISSYSWVNDSITFYIYEQNKIDALGWEKVCSDNMYDKVITLQNKNLHESFIYY